MTVLPSGVSSLLASVQASVIGHTLQTLCLEQVFPPNDEYVSEDPRPVLRFEDLQPFMVFNNLRRFFLHIDWNVDLTDSELLTLASAWPHLEHLVINADWGWNTPGGITSNGLLQLLQKCQLLSWITLAIDTRGYTEFRESPGLALPPNSVIDVVDSFIEEESVPAIATFLASIVPCADFLFFVGENLFTEGMDTERWYDAYNRANFALK